MIQFTDIPTQPLGKGEWTRSGSCDQCISGEVRGECCTKLALPVSPTAARNPDLVHFFALHGVDIKWWGDLPIAALPVRCSALLPNGDCSLYGSPERPDICSSGPLNPWTVQLFKSCSFKFEWDEKE